MDKLEKIKRYLADTPLYGLARQDCLYIIRAVDQLKKLWPIIQEATDFGEIGGDYVKAIGDWYEGLDLDVQAIIDTSEVKRG